MYSKSSTAERQKTVRAAARRLLRTTPVSQLTYLQIVTAAGFTRDSGLHIYPSKAAILLAVYTRAYLRWATDFVGMVTADANPLPWLQQSVARDHAVLVLTPVLEDIVLAALPTPTIAGYRQQRLILDRRLGTQIDALRPKTVHGTGIQLMIHTLWTLSWIHGTRHGVASEANIKALQAQHALALRRLLDAIRRIRSPS